MASVIGCFLSLYCVETVLDRDCNTAAAYDT